MAPHHPLSIFKLFPTNNLPTYDTAKVLVFDLHYLFNKSKN